MYSEFGGLINYYNRINNIEPIYEENETLTENKLTQMLNEFEKQTKNK